MKALQVFTVVSTILISSAVQNLENTQNILDELSTVVKEDQNNPSGLFENYSEVFRRFVNRGNFDLADSIYGVAQNYLTDEIDSQYVMDNLFKLAYMRKVQGRFSESLSLYIIINDHYIAQRNIEGLAFLNASLGEFYRAQGDEEECAKYLFEGLEFLKQHSIPSHTRAYLYSRLASYHSQFKADRDSTIYYANMALEEAILSKSPYIAGLSQNELGFIYMNLNPNDTTRSFDYYDQAIKRFLEENRFRDYISVLENKARAYFNLRLYNKAIKLLEEGIAIAESNDWLGYLDDGYFLLAQCYHGSGEYDLSNMYYDKAYKTKTETLIREHDIEVSELTSTYEKNVAEQNLLEARNETIQSENRFFTTILISGFLFIVALAGVISFIWFRKKNKTLKEQQETISLTNESLEKTLIEKESLFKELNHRVKNNLSVLSGLIYLQETRVSSPEIQVLLESLRNRVLAMAKVHEKLYGVNEASEIEFQEYLDNLIPELLKSLLKKDILVNTEIHCENLVLPINKAIPLALIFNELITNSIKHAGNDSTALKIKISSNSIQTGYELHYEDDGPGLTKAEDKSQHRPGSMGMKIIELMSMQLNGSVEATSTKDGLSYKITIK